MLSPKIVLVAEVTAAVLTMGAAFAIPAAALPGDSPSCQEGSGKTCTQAPPEKCPVGTAPAPVQPPAGEGVACDLDSLVRARAKADVLSHDELVRLCADVQVRQLVKVRVAVGKEHEVITLDGKTCGVSKPTYKDCWTAVQDGYHDVPSTDPRYDPRLDRDHDGIACETPPASAVPPASVAPVPVAPAPTIVTSNLPVTH